MEHNVDLSVLSMEQLVSLVKDANAQISSRKTQAVKDLKSEFVAKAASLGLTIDEVMSATGAKPAKATGEAKYANPADASQTWTGRGRKPQWVIDALSNGASLESLAI